MKGTLVVYRRELAGLFLAPLAWILLCGTLLVTAFFFVTGLRYLDGRVEPAASYVFGGPFWFLVSILAPLLTMRMISEESRSGLLEFLLTAPVGDAAVVAGKLGAATTFLALAWAGVPLFALVATLLGASPDWGQIAMQWTGAVLVSALFAGLGLVASSLSSTPLVAAFLAVVANLAVLLLPGAARQVRGPWRETAGWVRQKVDVQAHYYASFFTGALDTAHLVFYLAWILALGFLAVRLVESRRWVG